MSKVTEPSKRGKSAAPTRHPDRPSDGQGRQRDFRGAERHPGRRLRALSQDQEFPLARQRAAFPRLPPDARRAGRRDLRHDRRHRRARAQDRRHDAAFDRPHLQAADDRGQRRRIRRPGRHAARADGRQQGGRGRHAQGHEVCDKHEDVATASLLENFIDETEKRTWFLFEARAQGGRDPATERLWHNSSAIADGLCSAVAAAASGLLSLASLIDEALPRHRPADRDHGGAAHARLGLPVGSRAEFRDHRALHHRGSL